MTKGKPWSLEEGATLKALAEANTPIDIMAAKLKRKPDAVYVKCIRLGLAKRPLSLVSSIPLPKEHRFLVLIVFHVIFPMPIAVNLSFLLYSIEL